MTAQKNSNKRNRILIGFFILAGISPLVMAQQKKGQDGPPPTNG